MIFYLLLWHSLLLQLIFCSNTTVSEPSTGNKTMPDHGSEKLSNGTSQSQLLSLSEGGSILPGPETLLMALPKGNPAITSLDNDQDKRKIVPRKGVGSINSEEQDSAPLTNNTPLTTKNTTSKPSTTAEQVKTVSDQINSTTSKKVSMETSTLVNKLTNTTANVNKTNVPHKPLRLISDVLESITVKSSPETSNQLQSPNKVSSYITTANSHPGMVMPIVITILLVPMFAVLGYMALRRGQEAWKNRHYKRMDFLLDGMYND